MANTKEIEEGNRLIVEYMDLKTWISQNGQINYINPVLACHTLHLAYHESWGWLMPVIEKIGNFHYPGYFEHCPEGEERSPFEDCAWPRTFGMRDNEGNYMVRINASQLFIEKTLIEATWKAIIDFIEYYNSLSKPQGASK